MAKGPLAQKFWENIPENRQKKILDRAEKRIEEYRNL